MQKYLDQVDKYLKAQQMQKVFLAESNEDLFFLKTEKSAIYLYYLDLRTQNTQIKLDQAKKVTLIDFAKGGFEFHSYKPEEKMLYFRLDEKNNEFLNLFCLNLADQKLKQLTHVKNADSFQWTQDRKQIYFMNRFPIENGLFRSEFYRLNMLTLKQELLFDDQEWTYQAGWARFILSKCEKFLFVGVDHQSRREQTNFVQITIDDIVKNGMKPIESARMLPVSFEDASNYLTGAKTPEGFYFTSDSSKFENLYFFNFQNKQIDTITSEEWTDLTGGNVRFYEKDYAVFAQPLKKTGETRITLIDLTQRKRMDKVFSGNYKLAHYQAFVENDGYDQVPTVSIFNEHLEFGKSFARYVGENLTHATYELMSYPSFDGLEILAYLAKPKVPLRAVAVISFYGGENYYHFHEQLLLENGIAIFSPAVRGTWGLGRDWEDKIKFDLGGKEIVDVIWAAKFIANKLNLPENKIGLWGKSHGGYATLRGLTIPSPFAGVDTRFNFGFGISECGFADLENFHETSRIADWLVDLLGVYSDNKGLYRERSPNNYFANLKTPLFVRHGTTDTRVPLTTMQSFIDKLQNSNLKHDIMIQEDQGHHTNDPEKHKIERARIMKFLDSVLNES